MQICHVTSAPHCIFHNQFVKYFIFQFNPVFETVVSVDESGILEYWTGSKYDYKFPKKVKFESKLDTDLYEFFKCKTYPTGLCFNKQGDKFATICLDRKVNYILTVEYKRCEKVVFFWVATAPASISFL